jgi:hypothetical protein
MTDIAGPLRSSADLAAEKPLGYCAQPPDGVGAHIAGRDHPFGLSTYCFPTCFEVLMT